MSVKQSLNGNMSSFNNKSAYLERPRLRKLLENAMNYPLVVVCAGSGHGKTRAVYSFLQEYDSYTTWIQLSERDNIATRFWENYASMVSLSSPGAEEYGAYLTEIGFPGADDAFAKFEAVLQRAPKLAKKHITVFDDFHLLQNPFVLGFLEKALNALPPSVPVVLISRTMPDFNMIGMMMRERVFTIHEDTLLFTEEEIAEYFNQLKLQVTRANIRNIYDDTQGWAFAVNLIGRSLATERKYERYTLEAMKKNIFRLIEAEISQTISEPLRCFLMRISLIDHLAASLIKALAKDDSLVWEMELLNAYIRYDFNTDTYMIHHLFLDYLRQEQEQYLTDEERRETYQIAGLWCETNGYHMDAFSYYEKSGDYYSITRNIASFGLLMPQDMARYALDIFERAPDEMKFLNPSFPGMYVRLKTNLGQFDEALASARMYADYYETRPESPERSRALTVIYNSWGYLRLLMCTYTDAYDFDVHYKKMGFYFDKNPFKILRKYSSTTISAWASFVGTSRAGAQEEYIDAVSRATPYISRVSNGIWGFDDLARGELCFYRGEFDEAEQHLKQSLDKAREYDQYSMQNRALVYLMEIAFSRGNFASAIRSLQAMEAPLNEKDYGIRYTMYDIACGLYHLALGQQEQIPEWLKGEFSPYAHPVFLENYANRVKALYRYHARQYRSLLAFIAQAQERQTILYGKIELKVLEALSLYQLKQRSEAIAAFAEAYHLAEPNKIVMPFIQHAKDMRALTAAALKNDTCPIPREWLADINRKSSAYAKRKAKMTSEYTTPNHL